MSSTPRAHPKAGLPPPREEPLVVTSLSWRSLDGDGQHVEMGRNAVSAELTDESAPHRRQLEEQGIN